MLKQQQPLETYIGLVPEDEINYWSHITDRSERLLQWYIHRRLDYWLTSETDEKVITVNLIQETAIFAWRLGVKNGLLISDLAA